VGKTRESWGGGEKGGGKEKKGKETRKARTGKSPRLSELAYIFCLRAEPVCRGGKKRENTPSLHAVVKFSKNKVARGKEGEGKEKKKRCAVARLDSEATAVFVCAIEDNPRHPKSNYAGVRGKKKRKGKKAPPETHILPARTPKFLLETLFTGKGRGGGRGGKTAGTSIRLFLLPNNLWSET